MNPRPANNLDASQLAQAAAQAVLDDCAGCAVSGLDGVAAELSGGGGYRVGGADHGISA